jgi:hypothetical protein
MSWRSFIRITNYSIMRRKKTTNYKIILGKIYMDKSRALELFFTKY